MRVVLFIIICGLTLSACGNKGDLYMPSTPAETIESAKDSSDSNINKEEQ